MKKFLFAAIAILASVGVQAKSWTFAQVHLIGIDHNGDPYARLSSIDTTDNAYSNKLFKIDPKVKSTALAIGMAAAASNRKIYVLTNFDESPAGLPVITALYLSSDVVTSN